MLNIKVTALAESHCLTPKNLPETCYLFSYFVDNGQDGLRLAWSRDGLKWQALKHGESFLQPKVGREKIMRDPCIAQGPAGTFHMVWTDSWESQTIGYASSKDLLTWSEQRDLAVMKDEPAAKNCWAPEIVYDAEQKGFIIFWASTIPGRFPETEFGGKNDHNHRIYGTATRDFKTFTPTKLFFDPGFNCIDATILPLHGKFFMFFKDENKLPSPMKNLRLAVADRISGPYLLQADPINPPGSWVEGPSALQVGDTTYLYFDAYTKGCYSALRSRDLKTWEDVTPQLDFPKGTRHGTAFPVKSGILKRLLDDDNKPGR
ncbi:MAG: glycoside hydrolase family 43 protein [Verrucomicrobiae bacterium]